MSNDLIKNLKPGFDYLEEAEIEYLQRGLKPELAITSIPKLNDTLWGIPKSQLTLIAGRPSMGKSALAAQLAYDLAKQGKKVVFLSLEMRVINIIERLFAKEKTILSQDIQRGRFNQHKDKWVEFMREFSKLKISFSDAIGKTWEEIDQILTHLTVKPDAIFIDHINAIKTTGRNTKADIDNYIINMYSLAKHHNLAMVICCQINRDNQKDDDKTPQIHELKGSGNLEELSDNILMVHWPFKYQKEGQNIPKNKYLIIIGKNRMGETGYINVAFRPEYYQFTDLAREEDAYESARTHKISHWQSDD